MLTLCILTNFLFGFAESAIHVITFIPHVISKMDTTCQHKGKIWPDVIPFVAIVTKL